MWRLMVLSPDCNLMRATCDSGTSAPVLEVSTRLPMRFRAVARGVLEADRDVVVALADEDLADGAAADAGLDEIGDVGDIDAVSRRRLAIGRDGDLRQGRAVVDQHVGGAGHGLEDGGDFLCRCGAAP